MKKFYFILIVVFALLLPYNVCHADEINYPTYNIQIQDLDNGKIKVDFVVDEFEEVYATDVVLNFTKDNLEAIDIIHGNVIEVGSSTRLILDEVNNDLGEIEYCITRIGEVEESKKNGILFSVIFNVKSYENIDVSLNNSSIVTDKNGDIIDMNEENTDEPISIERIGNINSFKLGEDAEVKIKAANNSNKSKEVTLVVALFDSLNNKFLSYTAGNKVIGGGSDIELTGMMSIPKDGKYVVRAFIWDNLFDCNPLSDCIEIPVE